MKRLIIIVLVVVGLIGTAIAAAPFLAATDLAKRRIAAQIEEWTGRPVAFTGEPTVKLFPFLSLTIEDARIGNAEPAPGDEPFVIMDRLTCKLRLLPFLVGRIDVAEFQLVRPRFHLALDAEGHANWIMRRSSVVDEARETVADRPAGEAGRLRQVADIRLGRFKVFDGSITYDNKVSGRHEELGELTLALDWPSIAEPVSGTGAFSWRGETVEFNGSIGHPLDLIAGRSSDARFAIASKPIRVSFTGTAGSLGHLQLDGRTSVTTPSVRRVAEWFGTPMGEGSILGAGLIEGDLNWIGPSLSFSDARLELDGNIAEGTVSVDFANRRPKIQGTLATERLDLSAYLETFQATIRASGPWPQAPIRLPLLDIADADVRLSADQILFGAARIGSSAAAVTINDGALVVDLGEAQFYSGSLSANAAIRMSNDTMTGRATIKLDDTPAGVALADYTGLSLLDGAASATIDISGRGETWGALAQTLAGSASFEIADGTLTGIELGQFAALSGAPGIADPAAGTGTIPFKTLSGTLTLADGTVKGSGIEAEGETFAMQLDGQVSWSDEAVRANGVLMAARANARPDEVRREIPFVVGGRWAEPFLLPDYERLIRRGAENARPSRPTIRASSPL